MSIAANQFQKRLVVLLIIGPTVIKCIWSKSRAFDIVSGLGVGLAAFEAGRLARYSGFPVSASSTSVVSLAAFTYGAPGYLVAVPLSVVDKTAGKERLFNWPWILSTVGASWYVAAPIRAGVTLSRTDDGAKMLTFGMISTWLSDAAAYLIGPHMPGPVLPNYINSKKRWLGYVPGIAVSIIASRVAAPALGIPTGKALTLGVLMGLGSAAGDMLESGLKRRARQVDSSHCLPGYGGVLDRMDSLLVTIRVLNWAHNKYSLRINYHS